MNESPRYTQPMVQLSRGYFLVGGMIALCIGVALLLFAPISFLYVTAGLLCGGAVFMFLAFSKSDREIADAGLDPMDSSE